MEMEEKERKHQEQQAALQAQLNASVQIQQQMYAHQQQMMSMLVNKGVLTSPLPAPAVNWVSVVNLISPYYFLLFCCLTELHILQPQSDQSMLALLQQPPGQSPVTSQTVSPPAIYQWVSG